MPAQNSQSKEVGEVERIDGKRLEELSRKRIYFGHQSVGYNLLEGLAEVLREYPDAKIGIVELNANGSPTEAYGILHSKIGKNGNPFRKIQAFNRIVLEGGEGTRWDVAFFKFCYVDFYEGVNVEEIFDAYRKNIAEIQAKRPDLLLVHMTVPLTTGKVTPKEWVKSILGRKEIEYMGNINRNRFNELLRAEYGGKALIFDLAWIENIRPDGKRATFESGGRTYERLAGEYTDDGGHLNKDGRVRAGRRFLEFLAGLPGK